MDSFFNQFIIGEIDDMGLPRLSEKDDSQKLEAYERGVSKGKIFFTGTIQGPSDMLKKVFLRYLDLYWYYWLYEENH